MIPAMSQLPQPEPGLGPQDFAPIGTPVGPGAPLPRKPRANAWAITSLATGVVGCVPVVGVIAIITGIVGLKKANDPRFGGRGLAIGGIVLGVLGTLFAVFFGSLFFGLLTATGQPRQLAQDFVKMTSEGAADTAAHYTAKTIPRAQLDIWASQMQQWGKYQDLTSTSSSIDVTGGLTVCQLSGTATFADGDHPFEMTLIKENGAWKVSALSFD
jgi:hypothetical protein